MNDKLEAELDLVTRLQRELAEAQYECIRRAEKQELLNRELAEARAEIGAKQRRIDRLVEAHDKACVELRLYLDECAYCGGSLVRSTVPPYCEQCEMSRYDEAAEDWCAAVESLAKDGLIESDRLTSADERLLEARAEVERLKAENEGLRADRDLWSDRAFLAEKNDLISRGGWQKANEELGRARAYIESVDAAIKPAMVGDEVPWETVERLRMDSERLRNLPFHRGPDGEPASPYTVIELEEELAEARAEIDAKQRRIDRLLAGEEIESDRLTSVDEKLLEALTSPSGGDDDDE